MQQKIKFALRFSLLLAAVAVGMFGVYFAAPIPYIVPMSDVSAIERWVVHDHCVGQLSAWSRTYRFAGSAGRVTPDFNQVVVWFSDPDVPLPDGAILKAGVHRPWRNSMLFGVSYVDHRQQRVAFGVYDRQLHTMQSWNCGCNKGQKTWSALPKC